MTNGADTLADDPSPNGAVAAGTLLRAGREAAGLSIAAVAQQLKLAPRQIAALEDGDFTKLPGRTFVRGFVRNYARLLRLDSDAVLAALPETAVPPSLEHPSLAPMPRPMGELPADVHARPSAARWAIPLALVAVVTVAAVYEVTRPTAELSKAAVIDKPGAPAVLVAPSGNASSASMSANTTTALPNPLADTSPENATRAMDTREALAASPSSAADAPITLSFQGTSWVEVRDGTGVLIVSVIGNAGGMQAVSGRAPFDVVLGNAAAVTVTWQGKSFDTAPFTRQNVAKFTLR